MKYLSDSYGVLLSISTSSNKSLAAWKRFTCNIVQGSQCHNGEQVEGSLISQVPELLSQHFRVLQEYREEALQDVVVEGWGQEFAVGLPSVTLGDGFYYFLLQVCIQFLLSWCLCCKFKFNLFQWSDWFEMESISILWRRSWLKYHVSTSLPYTVIIRLM